MTNPTGRQIGYSLLAILIFAIVLACSGFKLNPLNPGGSTSTGTLSIAFACEKLDGRGNATRAFSYTMTPLQITGTSGKTTVDSGSQPSQTQPAATVLTVNGAHPAVFAWNITGYAYGTWKLTMQDDTNWTGSAKVTMTAAAPIEQVNFDSSHNNAIVTNDVNSVQYP